MTPGEQVAASALRAQRNAQAEAWVAQYRGRVLEAGNYRRMQVAALTRSSSHPGGWTESGVWWNDEGGSTHVRIWRDVERDLAA